MNIKRKAVEVVLSSGDKLVVKEPSIQHMATFFRALPAMAMLAELMEPIQAMQSGITGVEVNIPDSALEGIHPLLAIMADMSVEEFQELPLWDGLGVISALLMFLPKDLGMSDPTPVQDSTPTPSISMLPDSQTISPNGQSLSTPVG